jgi:hypothetical protein
MYLKYYMLLVGIKKKCLTTKMHNGEKASK